MRKLKFFAFVASFLLLIIRCSESVQKNYEDAFIKLSETHAEWLQLTSIPDAAHLLRYPPHSYRSKPSHLTPINISELLQPNMFSEWNNDVHRADDPHTCGNDLTQVIFNLKSEWALKMLDSDGKLVSGVLLGGVIWPGNYKECVSVYAPPDENDHGDFYGRYCVASWTVDLGGSFPELPITTGLCVPHTCNAESIVTAESNVIKILERLPLLKNFSSTLSLDSVECKKSAKTPDGSVIGFVFVLFLLIFLMLLGSAVSAYLAFSAKPRRSNSNGFSNTHPRSTSQSSCVDVIITQTSESKKEVDESFENNDICVNAKNILTEEAEVTHQTKGSGFLMKEVLLCFSAFKNGAKILNVEASSGQLLSLHGIRFLSLTWVILGHTYISAVAMIENRLEVLKDIDNWPFQVAMQAPFSVDSFFLLSGFLLTYLFLKEADKKKGKINWLYFYIHRLWRLTPAYMLVVGFYMIVFKYLGSGPFWDENYGDSCRHTWWWYLLYINNFIPVNDMCLGWSWYLANDMQFYLISPLFLYTLWRWPKAGLSFIVSLLVGSWVLTGVLSFKYELIPMFVGVTKVQDFKAYEKKMWYSFDMIYDKPYCRIGPYLIGVILAYALRKCGSRRNFLSIWQQALGWMIAAFLALSVVFGLYHADVGETAGAFYNAMCRSAFSCGLAWLIFTCETGHGGFIYKLLSMKFWIPLSRLTYCTYLIHPMLIHGYYQGLQNALYFTHTVMVINFFGFLVSSFCMAFLVSLAFESPMMNLEKLLTKKVR